MEFQHCHELFLDWRNASAIHDFVYILQQSSRRPLNMQTDLRSH